MIRTDVKEAFERLFGGSDWDSFEKFAFAYFDSNPNDYGAHAEFFQYFTPQWQQLCFARLYIDAEYLWRKAIDIANKWEKASGGHIHKGTPFYFWGGTALVRGEVDFGFILIHEALYEDIRAEALGGRKADTLPAWYFVILKDEE